MCELRYNIKFIEMLYGQEIRKVIKAFGRLVLDQV